MAIILIKGRKFHVPFGALVKNSTSMLVCLYHCTHYYCAAIILRIYKPITFVCFDWLLFENTDIIVTSFVLRVSYFQKKKTLPFFSLNIASQMSNFYICICIAPYFLYFWKCNLPMNPYVRFCVVGRSIGRSVWKFLNRQESYTSIAPLGELVFVPYHQ